MSNSEVYCANAYKISRFISILRQLHIYCLKKIEENGGGGCGEREKKNAPVNDAILIAFYIKQKLFAYLKRNGLCMQSH